MATEIINTTPDCEIATSRNLNFAIEKVFEAFANPAHLKNWWGPAGFTNTFNEFDFKVGGKWSFVMHGPEAGNYANECEFIKIEKPSLIAWKRHSQPLFQVLFTFESLAQQQTKIIFKMLLTLRKSAVN